MIAATFWSRYGNLSASADGKILVVYSGSDAYKLVEREANPRLRTRRLRTRRIAMTFVNEMISEEEKDRIGRNTIKDPDGTPHRLYKWTVDRDRDVFLVPTRYFAGPEAGCDRRFALCFNNRISYLHLRYEIALMKDGRERITWRIISDLIPDEVRDRRPTLLLLLKEALDVWGMDFVRFDNMIIEFEF